MSIVPYTLKSLKSHVEVTFHPPVSEGSWSEIDKLGNEVIEETEQRKAPQCLIDLSELTYIGSSIVAVLVRVWKEVKSKDGKMAIVVTHPVVKETITLAGLDKVWDLHQEINDACREIGIPIRHADGKSQKARRVKIIAGVIILLACVGGAVFYFMNQNS